MKTKFIVIIASIVIVLGIITETAVILSSKYNFENIFQKPKQTQVKQENVTKQDIDDFLEVYDRDFDENIKENFKKEFDKVSRRDVLKKNKVESFLNSVDPKIADKFKNWFYASQYKGFLDLDGSVNFIKPKSEEEIKENLKYFDKHYNKIAHKQDSTRKELFEKLRKEIENGNISFRTRDKKTIESLLNMTTIRLEKFANLKKEDLIYTYIKDHPETKAQTIIKDMGISEDVPRKVIANISAYRLLLENFLTQDQYKKLGNNFNDVNTLKYNLANILTSDQRYIMRDAETTVADFANNIIKRGFYTDYTFKHVKNMYPDDPNDAIRDIMAGVVSLDRKTVRGLKAIAIPKKYNPTKEDAALIKKVFSDVIFADINTQHSQIIDVANVANDKYKMPKILINFDSHSDMYVKPGGNKRANIADWVNYAASIDGVEKIIWVVPKHSIVNNPDADRVYFGGRMNIKQDGAYVGNVDYTQIQDSSKPLVQKIYLNTYSKEITPVIGNKKPRGRHIKVLDFIVCTQDTIPDLKGEDVFMSIDGDYFNNCGFDTSEAIATIPFNLNSAFSDFLHTLDKKNIKAKFLSCSTSPEYTSYARSQDIYGFFKYILSAIGRKDEIQYYYNRLTRDITPQDEKELSEY